MSTTDEIRGLTVGNQRWYDSDPNLSMAISLLQNSPPQTRDKLLGWLKERLREHHGWLEKRITEEVVQGFWAFLQKRKTMNNQAWLLVESLQYLPEPERKQIALELIQEIYTMDTQSDWLDNPPYQAVI